MIVLRIRNSVDEPWFTVPIESGDDGFSPTITVSAISGGHRLTITDKNETKTVDVMDGSDGKSAYQYAKDAGYTGTEADFAALLTRDTYSKSEVDTELNKKLNKSGGTLSGKFVLPTNNENVGFVNSGDVKIIGYGGGNFKVGDVGVPLQFRGSGTNPLYGDKKIPTEDDVYSKSEVDTALGAYIEDIAALVGGDA